MAVIIDMNIPKYCKQCPMCMEVRDTFAYCMLLGYQLKITELDLKDGYCPLKEVKEFEAEDCISRKKAIISITACNGYSAQIEALENLPSVLPKADKPIIYCRDCKWWKESDGTYDRGVHAESKCLMNTKTIYEGNGYCYLAEPKMESEDNK